MKCTLFRLASSNLISAGVLFALGAFPPVFVVVLAAGEGVVGVVTVVGLGIDQPAADACVCVSMGKVCGVM